MAKKRHPSGLELHLAPDDRQFRILLKFPWGEVTERFDDGIIVSTEFSHANADALLCWWEPTKDLMFFDGIKAWACEEPFEAPGSVRNSPHWTQFTDFLRKEERFHHYQDTDTLQIFPIIHLDSSHLSVRRDLARRQNAVAVISNTGRLGRRGFDVRLRLRFAVAPRVDLYGSTSSWARFRQFPWSRPRPPQTYRGECPGYWGSDAKLDLMSGYKVAVCLENSCESNYFTEKFVDAVRAGCIPIYRAHPSNASGILKAAKWVDPAHFGLSVQRTLDFALEQSCSEYQDINEAWLKSTAVRERSFPVMLEKVCKTLRHRWACQRKGG